MTTTIELKNITFRYTNQRQDTLNIPSLTINSSEKVFLYGPSGSGKSTLLELLAGVLAPTSGTISILEQKISELTSPQRDAFRADHMGYIFQNFNLIPYLSTAENITLPLYLSTKKRGKINTESEFQELQKLTKDLGIYHLLGKKVFELSVGQQQRVAVARALMGSPEIILADEPTSALDHDRREKFIDLLFEVTQKKATTIIFVSHDKSLEKIFDRSISLTEINKATQNDLI